VAADGRDFLEKHEAWWDLVIMDAFDGTEPPARLVDDAALSLLRKRTSESGATALRLYGMPADDDIAQMRRRLRVAGGGQAFEHMFGSGIGLEMQNLYVVVGAAPLNMVGVTGAALWPLPDDLLARTAVSPGVKAPATDVPPPTRPVTLVGYVHRLAGGEVALDLPHAEMGAVRYLLVGEPAGNLAATLPADARFPTAGDIGTDGDTSKTLRPLLGGGGAKRSDVRFSPLVAAVTGSARLLAVVHADAASRVPASVRGNAPTDDRIPYGGSLYELTVTGVLWTLDRAAWSAAAPGLDRSAAAAGAAAARADLEAAEKELGQWADALAGKLGDHADLVPAVRGANVLASAMHSERYHLSRGAAQASAFERGGACDRLHHRYGAAAPPPIAAGLLRCAVDNYVKAATAGKPDDADGYDAAARLAQLLDASDPRRKKLVKKFGIKQPMLFPPESI
jgi:hypothetical protein